jgi:hypothetical protein
MNFVRAFQIFLTMAFLTHSAAFAHDMSSSNLRVAVLLSKA